LVNKEKIIKIESETEPGKTYEVNLVNHTCTCLHYVKKLHALDAHNPHRLCKHLVMAMADNNTFDGFEQFKDEILWFAKAKSAFSSKEKALNKKSSPPKKPPKEIIPRGAIQTISREITDQPDIGSTPFYLWCEPDAYHHIKGKVQDVIIEAIIPERKDIGLYSINGQRAREYHFGKSVSDETENREVDEAFTISIRVEEEPIPRQYKYLQEALHFWLEQEYSLINQAADLKKR
jgi:hypothetical protein